MALESLKFEIRYQVSRALNRVLTDEQWSRWMHWYLHRNCGAEPYTLNLHQPQSFNEKIIWMKIFHRFTNGHMLADKYTVRQYVADTVGSKYLVPLLGVYGAPDEIDLSSLPSAFAIKATHGSGWNIIVDDKSAIDIRSFRRSLARWLRYNYYFVGREWQYRDCPHRIICEEYLGGRTGRPLLDYKFFCFHGEPQFIQVDVDRFANHTRSFYSLDWVRQPFSVLFPECKRDIPQPQCLDEMLNMARLLARGLTFARIDLYNLDGRIYFGEITLHPGGGCEPFFPPEYDRQLGDHLDISGCIR